MIENCDYNEPQALEFVEQAEVIIPPGIEARDYQLAAVEQILADAKAGIKEGHLVIGTGGGKTLVCLMTLLAIKEANNGELNALWIVPGQDASLRPTEDIERFNLPLTASNLSSGTHLKKLKGEITCMTNSMFKRRSKRLIEEHSANPYQVIIIDEAHRDITTRTSKNILAKFDGVLKVHATATPNFTDGHLFCEYGYRELINGYVEYQKDDKGDQIEALCQFPQWVLRRYHVKDVVLPKRTTTGLLSFELETVDSESGKEKLKLPHHVSVCHQIAIEMFDASESGLFAFASINGSKFFVEAFKKLHPEFAHLIAHIDGSMSPNAKTDLLRKLRNKEILALAGCDLLVESINVPHLKHVALARPTSSRRIIMQFIGRAARRHPDKDFVAIHDIVWAVANSDSRHFNPNNQPLTATGVLGVKKVAKEGYTLLSDGDNNAIDGDVISLVNGVDGFVSTSTYEVEEVGWQERMSEFNFLSKPKLALEVIHHFADLFGVDFTNLVRSPDFYFDHEASITLNYPTGETEALKFKTAWQIIQHNPASLKAIEAAATNSINDLITQFCVKAKKATASKVKSPKKKEQTLDSEVADKNLHLMISLLGLREILLNEYGENTLLVWLKTKIGDWNDRNFALALSVLRKLLIMPHQIIQILDGTNAAEVLATRLNEGLLQVVDHGNSYYSVKYTPSTDGKEAVIDYGDITRIADSSDLMYLLGVWIKDLPEKEKNYFYTLAKSRIGISKIARADTQTQYGVNYKNYPERGAWFTVRTEITGPDHGACEVNERLILSPNVSDLIAKQLERRDEEVETDYRQVNVIANSPELMALLETCISKVPKEDRAFVRKLASNPEGVSEIIHYNKGMIPRKIFGFVVGQGFSIKRSFEKLDSTGTIHEYTYRLVLDDNINEVVATQRTQAQLIEDQTPDDLLSPERLPNLIGCTPLLELAFKTMSEGATSMELVGTGHSYSDHLQELFAVNQLGWVSEGSSWGDDTGMKSEVIHFDYKLARQRWLGRNTETPSLTPVISVGNDPASYKIALNPQPLNKTADLILTEGKAIELPKTLGAAIVKAVSKGTGVVKFSKYISKKYQEEIYELITMLNHSLCAFRYSHQEKTGAIFIPIDDVLVRELPKAPNPETSSVRAYPQLDFGNFTYQAGAVDYRVIERISDHPELMYLLRFWLKTLSPAAIAFVLNLASEPLGNWSNPDPNQTLPNKDILQRLNEQPDFSIWGKSVYERISDNQFFYKQVSLVPNSKIQPYLDRCLKQKSEVEEKLFAAEDQMASYLRYTELAGIPKESYFTTAFGNWYKHRIQLINLTNSLPSGDTDSIFSTLLRNPLGKPILISSDLIPTAVTLAKHVNLPTDPIHFHQLDEHPNYFMVSGNKNIEDRPNYFGGGGTSIGNV